MSKVKEFFQEVILSVEGSCKIFQSIGKTRFPIECLGEGTGIIAYKHLPWKTIAEWTHRLPKTPTDYWMDVVNGVVRGPLHRWQHHHFIIDAIKVARDENLSLIDFYKHLGLDFITKTGIPLLPDTFLQWAHDTLDIPLDMLKEWTLLNVVDVGIGIISVHGGISNLILAINGELPWGAKTIILTIGRGVLETTSGVATQNPVLVAGGLTNIASGLVSAWEYYSQPFILGVPLEEVFQGIFESLGVAGAFTALQILFSWKVDAAQITERLLYGTTIGALATIGAGLSLPSGLTYSAGKLSFKMARADNRILREFPIYSPFAFKELIEKFARTYGVEEVKRFLQYQEKLEAFEVKDSGEVALKERKRLQTAIQLEKKEGKTMNKKEFAKKLKDMVELKFQQAEAINKQNGLNGITYNDICLITDLIVGEFHQQKLELPKEIEGAINLAKGYLNPNEVAAKEEIKKGIYAMVSTVGGISLAIGIIQALASPGILAGLCCLILGGTTVPMEAPIAIGAGILLVTVGIYKTTRNWSIAEATVKAEEVLIKAIEEWKEDKQSVDENVLKQFKEKFKNFSDKIKTLSSEEIKALQEDIAEVTREAKRMKIPTKAFTLMSNILNNQIIRVTSDEIRDSISNIELVLEKTTNTVLSLANYFTSEFIEKLKLSKPKEKELLEKEKFQKIKKIIKKL